MSDRAEASRGRFWADAESSLDRYAPVFDMVDDTLDDGIYQLDAEGRFVAVNDALVELTGYSRAALLGQRASLVLTDEDVNRIRVESEPREGSTFSFTLPATDT